MWRPLPAWSGSGFGRKLEWKPLLAVAVLVVAVLGGEAHLLHGQADVPADVLAGVQRRYVEIAACVDGDAGGAAPVVKR